MLVTNHKRIATRLLGGDGESGGDSSGLTRIIIILKDVDEMNVSIGIDIGGTKCALSIGDCSTESVRIQHREEFPTKGKKWQEVLEEFGKRIS